MRTKYKSIIKSLGILTLGLLLNTSCVDYLDKAPEVNVTDEDVFGEFKKYQGFVEDIYQCVVDVTHANAGAEANWNYGLDEGILTDQRMLSAHFEKGNYWQWESTANNAFAGTTSSPGNSTSGKGYWGNGWYGIRKANMAIKNIGMMVNGTDQERAAILGQAYFFRAYLHFEILRHWGHIAYIDSVYSPTDDIKPVPISYQECAARIDADLRKAVEYLPASWDDPNWKPGELTGTKNAIRVTKGAAWAYIGLNALYAASPLMAQDATRPNNPDSSQYDIEQCKKAATAYNEVLKLAAPAIAGGDGSGGYDLETWKDYHFNFWAGDNRTQTGKEVIWTYPNTRSKRWSYGDFNIQQLGAWGTYYGPTANYVEYFGMANGLPIHATGSGYDPMNPWVGRDPRFDYNIKYDGERQVINTVNADTYAEFFIGGRHRNSSNSLSGYGYTKFQWVQANRYDNKWGGSYYYDCPKVRLAGVLLEFAEASNEAYGPTTVGPGLSMSAVDAVNKVRARVMCPPYTNAGSNTIYDYQDGGTPLPAVDSRFTGNKETFRQIIRQERAVELAFEGHRWNDLRRWGVASAPKYREKWELQFDKAHTYFTKVLYLTSVFEPKHWWLPFPVKQVSLYPEFKQNPGW